jgi:hypothetical protein
MNFGGLYCAICESLKGRILITGIDDFKTRSGDVSRMFLESSKFNILKFKVLLSLLHDNIIL